MRHAAQAEVDDLEALGPVCGFPQRAPCGAKRLRRRNGPGQGFGKACRQSKILSADGLRGLLVPGAFAGQHAGQKGVKTEKRFKGRVFIGIPGIARLKLRIMRAHGEPGGVGGKELHQGVLIQQEFGRVDRAAARPSACRARR